MSINVIPFTKEMTQFKDYLGSSLANLAPFLEQQDSDSDPYVLDDWCVQNWNLLVGRSILGRKSKLLEYSFPYIGYAYLKQSSSHRVICSLLPGEVAFDLASSQIIDGSKWVFHSFVGLGPNGYDYCAPFDCVRVYDEVAQTGRILSLRQVEFGLERL